MTTVWDIVYKEKRYIIKIVINITKKIIEKPHITLKSFRQEVDNRSNKFNFVFQ